MRLEEGPVLIGQLVLKTLGELEVWSVEVVAEQGQPLAAGEGGRRGNGGPFGGLKRSARAHLKLKWAARPLDWTSQR